MNHSIQARRKTSKQNSRKRGHIKVLIYTVIRNINYITQDNNRSSITELMVKAYVLRILTTGQPWKDRPVIPIAVIPIVVYTL